MLAAIIHHMRTGEGQKVEIPMFEAFTNFMLIEHLAGLTFDPPNAPVGYFRQIDPDRQPFPTSDGHISIDAYADEAWPRVFACKTFLFPVGRWYSMSRNIRANKALA